MSDYNSSLPIRTESAGDAIVKVADATTPSQQLKVESDGSINVNGSFSLPPGSEIKITDGTDDLAVNTDGSLNAVVTATDLDIRDLTFASDKVDASGSALGANSGVDIGDVTVNNGSGASAVNIQDGGNSITVDGTVAATQSGTWNIADITGTVSLPTGAATAANQLPDGHNVTVDNGSGAAAVNIQDGGNSITVDGSVTVSATDLDIRNLSASQDNVAISDGTDTLAINTDGSINVKLADRSGTEVDSYNTVAAVAGGATSNHDYTTTGDFRLTSVSASGSGKMKIEIQTETASGSNTFNTKCVLFNSTSTPNMSFELASPILVASGARVRVIRTNRDNQAQDVYSTILGYNE